MAVTQSTDTCTSNHATLSPLFTDCTLSKGNLKAVATGNAYQWAISTIAIPTTGKWVFEAQSSNINGTSSYGYVGICQMGNHNVDNGTNYIFGINLGNGEVVKNNGVEVDIGAGPTTSLMRIEYDADNDTIKIFDDNSEIFPASTGVTNVTGLTGHNSLHFYVAPYASGTDFTVNFGASSFTHTPTSGYKVLNTTNLLANSAPTIEDGTAHFQTIAEWSGNSSSQTVSQTGNSGFTPDWAIIKSKSFGNGANSYDVVRGGNKGLATFDNGAEDTESDGVTFGISSEKGTLAFTGAGASGDINNSGRTYCAWTWKAGDSNTVVSESGTGDDAIAACTHRANQTAGFSIVKYQGKNDEISNGEHTKVAHGLGVKPTLIIGKNLAAGNDWFVMSIPQQNDAHIHLNTTAANVGSDFTGTWSDSDATHFVVGNDDLVNKAGADYISYVFAEIPGYSKFGSYKGNGSSSTPPFVHLGFKPQFILLKNIDVARDWVIVDTARTPINPIEEFLFMNLAIAEAARGSASGSDYDMDLISNGFRPITGDSAINGNDNAILYLAFAEHPFAGTTPATAR